jgi:hypothetical protein
VCGYGAQYHCVLCTAQGALGAQGAQGAQGGGAKGGTHTQTRDVRRWAKGAQGAHGWNTHTTTECAVGEGAKQWQAGQPLLRGPLGIQWTPICPAPFPPWSPSKLVAAGRGVWRRGYD